jgi:hypothetical protein
MIENDRISLQGYHRMRHVRVGQRAGSDRFWPSPNRMNHADLCVGNFLARRTRRTTKFSRRFSVLQHQALTERVMRLATEVHRTIGLGLLESVYTEVLASELEETSIPFGP